MINRMTFHYLEKRILKKETFECFKAGEFINLEFFMAFNFRYLF